MAHAAQSDYSKVIIRYMVAGWHKTAKRPHSLLRLPIAIINIPTVVHCSHQLLSDVLPRSSLHSRSVLGYPEVTIDPSPGPCLRTFCSRIFLAVTLRRFMYAISGVNSSGNVVSSRISSLPRFPGSKIKVAW
jgi:hypothetical protein